ncbi:MAG TPA: hypothetical protein VEG61_02605, partial [Candidatus Dormibacteraeota bacterium]|nr:hypothetical protein [Candidatus Dormibacteraeota bacterium]
EAYPWKDWSLNAEGTPVFYRQYAKSMADLGRPVFIQETGYPSEGCGELCVDNWPAWNRVFDESTQAAWVRYMLGIAFGTEGIIGVTSWFVDLRPDDWSVQSFKSMGLATRDGRAKQAYSAYLDEVENFTTSGRGITDAQGRVSFRGFAGYYTIAVTAADGQRSKIGIHVLQLSNSTHAGRQDFTITFAPHPMVNSTSTTIQIATTTSAIVMTSPSQTVVTTSSQEITPSPNYEPYIIAGVIGIVAAVCFAVVRRRTRRKLE